MGIIVLRTEGKGRTTADFVTVTLHSSEAEANEYCRENTKSGKYWSLAEIVEQGQRLEPWYMENMQAH